MNTSPSGFAQLDHCFESLWHFDSVLLPPTAQESPMMLCNCPHAASIRSSPEVDSSPARNGLPAPDCTHRLLPLFRLMDENHDGEVSVDEMMCRLSKLVKDLSRSCLVSLIETINRNDDMAVDFGEFIALYESIYSSGTETNCRTDETEAEVSLDEIIDAFNVYDKNRDGYICAAELAEVLRDLGLSEGMDVNKCQTLINNVDTDGNGLVDLKEFKAMLCRGCHISDASITREDASPTDVVEGNTSMSPSCDVGSSKPFSQSSKELSLRQLQKCDMGIGSLEECLSSTANHSRSPV